MARNRNPGQESKNIVRLILANYSYFRLDDDDVDDDDDDMIKHKYFQDHRIRNG